MAFFKPLTHKNIHFLLILIYYYVQIIIKVYSFLKNPGLPCVQDVCVSHAF